MDRINKHVPIIDVNSPSFKQELDFNLWSTTGSSDYRNDRERPYNGQPWTDHGIRGQHQVSGLTMRDVCDCFIKALIISCPSDVYLEKFSDCWDFSDVKSESDKPKPTQFLLDNIELPEYVTAKVELGIWRYQDVYKLDLSKVDPLAIQQNLGCEIERMMGIFPNINIESNG